MDCGANGTLCFGPCMTLCFKSRVHHNHLPIFKYKCYPKSPYPPRGLANPNHPYPPHGLANPNHPTQPVDWLTQITPTHPVDWLTQITPTHRVDWLTQITLPTPWTGYGPYLIKHHLWFHKHINWTEISTLIRFKYRGFFGICPDCYCAVPLGVIAFLWFKRSDLYSDESKGKFVYYKFPTLCLVRMNPSSTTELFSCQEQQNKMSSCYHLVQRQADLFWNVTVWTF